MFYSNEDVREEFAADDHYVGSTRNHPAQLFCVVINCYEAHMVLVQASHEEHPKPIWLVKALSSPNFVITSPTFVKLRWNIAVQAPKIQMCSARI